MKINLKKSPVFSDYKKAKQLQILKKKFLQRQFRRKQVKQI